MDLPGDVGRAAEALDNGMARLDAWREALPVAEERLRRFTETAAVAYAVPYGAPEAPQAEAELTSLLAELSQADTGLNYAPGWWPSARLRETVDRFQAFVRQLFESLARYAHIETSVQGHLIVRTIVTWRGDFPTVWQRATAGEWAALHGRSLDLALTTRDTWLRVLLLALRGALLVATAFALPGGPILALPAVWRYLRRVCTELDIGKSP